jgi:hypothetical protein
LKTWQFYIGLSLGLLVGSAVGYLVGVSYASATLRDYREHLEVIYFLTAGPLLLVVFVAGLTQILVSVREISSRSQREGAMLAIATCEKFAHEYVTMEPKAVEQLSEIHLPFVEWKLSDDSLQWPALAKEPEARAWAQSLEVAPAVFLSATEVVNLLEAIAMSFIYGKANDDVGYRTIGAPFCQAVRRWAPHLISLRSQQTSAASGAFFATVTLYRKWESRRLASAP